MVPVLFLLLHAQGGRDFINKSREAIWKRYRATHRFRLDSACLLPIDVIAVGLGGYFSLFRCSRFLRVSLMGAYVSDLVDHLKRCRGTVVSSAQSSMATSAFNIIVMFHVFTVMWSILHFVPTTAGAMYWDALYWVVTTFTTVGYGDITPNDSTETLFALFVGVIGALFAAAVVANVTAYVHDHDVSDDNLDHQEVCVRRFLTHYGVSDDVKRKVFAYFAHVNSTTATSAAPFNASAKGLHCFLGETARLGRLLPKHVQVRDKTQRSLLDAGYCLQSVGGG